MTVLADHPWEPYPDSAPGVSEPRRPRSCRHCNRVPEVHPRADNRLAVRNPEFEREFIKGAAKLAGIDNGWVDAVHDRMQGMEREKGTSAYLKMSLGRVVAEADCEGLDLGGWPVLGALLAYRDVADDETRLYVQSELQQMAALGALVRMHADNIREVLR